MADLFNQQISATYSGLLKTSSSGVLSASLSQISDGRGNTSPLYLSTGSIQFYGEYAFPNTDGLDGQVLKTDGAGVLTWENDSLSNTLNFSGGTGTGSVTLDSQVLAFTGTANQIETSASSQAITLSFPTAGVTLPNGSIATTQTASDNSTKVATTAYVDNQVSTAGTVTSVALSVPTGLTVTGSPITTSGTIAIANTSGYSIPTDAKQTQWDTAYTNRITTATSPLSITTNTISLGTVGVANGGTGATTLTGILLGNGTSAISSITSASDGYVLTADGIGGYAFEVSSGDVTGTGANTQVAFWDSANTLTGEAEFIYTNGRIEINRVDAKGASPILAINATTSGNPVLYFRISGNTQGRIFYDNSASKFIMRSELHDIVFERDTDVPALTIDGTTGAATFISSASNNFIINSTDTDGGFINLQRDGANLGWIGSAYHTIAPVGLNSDLAVNSVNGNLILATSSTEKMRISSGGNVGIGTGSTIYADLEIKRASEVTVALHNSSSITSGNRGNISFYNSSVSTVALIKAVADTDNVGTALEFYTRPVGGSLTNSLTISSGGAATFSGNVILGDSIQLQLGSGNDSQVYHSGGHLFIDNSVGNSYIRNTSTGDILLRNSTAGDIQFDNEIAGNILFNTSNIPRMRIDSDGNVGIGTTPSGSGFEASGYVLRLSGGGQTYVAFNNSTHTTQVVGGFVIGNDSVSANLIQRENQPMAFYTNNLLRVTISSGGAVFMPYLSGSSGYNDLAYNTANGQLIYRTSSVRYKENIQDFSPSLDKILNLRTVTYDEKETQRSYFGLIAEELYEHIPELVTLKEIEGYEEPQPDGITYSMLSIHLLKAIQEQQTIIEDLKSRIETLEG